jgi:actin-related protein 5
MPETYTYGIGSSSTRAGWSFDKSPRLSLTPIFSKYRDRKIGKTYSFVGADVYADTTARGHMRNAFEVNSSIVSNWDVMESILDYTFIKLGVDGANGGVNMPIVMTEAVANLPYSRKCKFIPVRPEDRSNETVYSYDGDHF